MYRGTKNYGGEVVVTFNDVPLDPRLDLFNHPPIGFDWGYSGSGSAQLALAVLAHHFKDDDRAMKLYQQFKFAVFAGIHKKIKWTLTPTQIDTIVAKIETKA